VPKLVMKVSHLTCDSHTSFKVKQSKVRVTDRQDKPGSHTPCCMCLTRSSITSLWTVNKVPFVQETANNFYTVSLLTTLTQKGFNCIITASNKYSGPRMANVTNPHCHQYVDCWPNCPSHTLAAHSHGRQHYCTAGQVRPLPDKYVLLLATDKWTDKRTDK